eukprot:6486880-Amphidinium_carterae.1
MGSLLWKSTLSDVVLHESKERSDFFQEAEVARGIVWVMHPTQKHHLCVLHYSSNKNHCIPTLPP